MNILYNTVNQNITFILMKKTLFLLLLTFLAYTSHAQRGEIGAFSGISYYQGDLSAGLGLHEPNFGFGFFAGYAPIDHLTIKGSFYRGQISGNDKHHSGGLLLERNLSFKSTLSELGLRLEYNIFGFRPEGMYTPFSPYVFIGAALTHHNPMTEYQGEWHELQPLGTEGQGIPGYSQRYNRVIFAIPVGAGIKYALNENLSVGFEMGLRTTFTDYLDDVSTVYVAPEILLEGSSRGNLAAILSNRTGEFLEEPSIFENGAQRGGADVNDYYFMGGVTVFFTINGY